MEKEGHNGFNSTKVQLEQDDVLHKAGLHEFQFH